MNGILKHYFCENNLIKSFMKEKKQYRIGTIDIYKLWFHKPTEALSSGKSLIYKKNHMLRYLLQGFIVQNLEKIKY